MSVLKCMMLVFLLTFISVTTIVSASDQVYKWVDEQGVVHFSDRPNDSKKSEIIKVDTFTPSAPSGTDSENDQSGADANPYAQKPDGEKSAAQIQREKRAEQRMAAAEQQKVVDELCQKYRVLVSKLEPSTRVMVTAENGEVYRMDDNDRLNKLNELQAFISQNCN